MTALRLRPLVLACLLAFCLSSPGGVWAAEGTGAVGQASPTGQARAVSRADAFRAKCHALNDRAVALVFDSPTGGGSVAVQPPSPRTVLADELFAVASMVAQIEDLLDWACSLGPRDQAMREHVSGLLLDYGVRLGAQAQDIRERGSLCARLGDRECARRSRVIAADIDGFVRAVFAFSGPVATGAIGRCTTKARPTSKVE